MWFREDYPIVCNEAPLSTMYTLSVECIAKEQFVLWTYLQGPFVLKSSLWSLYPLCLVNSSCSSFHSVDLWPYGGKIWRYACEHWTDVVVMSLRQDMDISREVGWNNLHDSFGDLRIKSFKLRVVLVEHESWMVQNSSASCCIHFCWPIADQSRTSWSWFYFSAKRNFPRTGCRRVRARFKFEFLCFFPVWGTFIGNWSRVR